MLLASAASSASETILAPLADGTILDQSPFNGIGNSGEVLNDLAVGVGLNSGILDARGVVEYDLTQLNRDLRVQSAILRMKIEGKSFLPGTTIAPVQVMGYRGDGTLQANDFNQGTFVRVYDAFPANNGAIIEVDVTRFIRAAERRLHHYVGFSFRTNVHGFFRDYGSLDTDEPIKLVVVQ
jgi:hypothetical protein